MKKINILFAVLFSVCAAFARAQNIEELFERGKNDFETAQRYVNRERFKRIEADDMKPQAARSQWFYKSQKEVDDYINKNAVTADNARAARVYASLFQQSDLLLMGERHENDDGLKRIFLRLILDYNKQADALNYKKITDIFYENPSEDQQALDGAKTVAALITADADKEAYCDFETKKYFKARGWSFEKQPAIALLCVLNASGVNVVFPDFNTYVDSSPRAAEYCEGHKRCLLCPSAHISVVDDLGEKLRNALIFSKIKAAVDAGGKAVFLGGATHVGYGGIGRTVSLSDMAAVDLKDKAVYSVLTFYRAGALAPLTEKNNCEKCKKAVPLFLESFLPKLGNQFLKDKFKFILFVPENNTDAAYRSRPADMLVLWPS
ncbi:MAG: hypothetical protein LBI01_07195 [Elusimicrobium sp.]|jgi:hypothetical protein|nr:hypothetical protein [Elusimicrobium sp.]